MVGGIWTGDGSNLRFASRWKASFSTSLDCEKRLSEPWLGTVRNHSFLTDAERFQEDFAEVWKFERQAESQHLNHHQKNHDKFLIQRVYHHDSNLQCCLGMVYWSCREHLLQQLLEFLKIFFCVKQSPCGSYHVDQADSQWLYSLVALNGLTTVRLTTPTIY